MTRTPPVVALTVALLLSPASHAQAPVQGSQGCASLVQAAADGMSARIAADNQTIPMPQSISSLTCLDWFMNGVGLDILNPAAMAGRLLTSAGTTALMQACAAARASWNNVIGSVNCGLNVTGFNVGFGGALSGLFCPRLSFGGGGPPVGSASLLPGMQNGFFIRGEGATPIGYQRTAPTGFTFSGNR